MPPQLGTGCPDRPKNARVLSISTAKDAANRALPRIVGATSRRKWPKSVRRAHPADRALARRGAPGERRTMSDRTDLTGSGQAMKRIPRTGTDWNEHLHARRPSVVAK